MQNNMYLIPVEVNLHQMLGPKNPVPKLRYTTRGDMDTAVASNQKRVGDWRDKELNVVWKMDSDLQRLALSL